MESEETRRTTNSSKKRIPTWVSVSIFAGTAFALGVPLVLIRRQRAQTLKQAFSNSSPPSKLPVENQFSLRSQSTSTPVTATAAVHFARGLSKSKSKSLVNGEREQQQALHLRQATPPSPSTSPSSSSNEQDSSESEFSSPGPKELLSAISRVNYSTALFAAKAFGIATCLVTMGALGVTWGVKTWMGINDTREFAHRIRLALRAYLPSLSSRIHRPPETEEERALFEGVTAPTSTPAAPGWNVEEAEERLKVAYEKGGVGLWARVAVREVEEEVRIEREKRRSGAGANGSGS
ncbi:hypothetical protein AX17_002984 [Amanita inopinata Kibby_2008]|nr:hypothetical protein AX17_002984 [Amanita inopinata Kibby_2008]